MPVRSCFQRNKPISWTVAGCAPACCTLILQHSNADYRIGPFKYLLAGN